MSGRTFLVTGGSGFVGRHLLRRLAERGEQVTCITRRPAGDLPAGIQRLNLDLCSPQQLAALPKRWHAVIHLAGESIPSQFQDAEPIARSLQSALYLLEHLEAAKILLVSSCHVYAPSPEVRTEDSRLAPQGRYGLSKLLIEQMAGHYGRTLDIRIARPFNHLGPGQRAELVMPTLIRRLREARDRASGPLVMHGENSIRDFVDVRDVVEAYLAILEMDQPVARCFNVCSGVGRRISEVGERAMALLGFRTDLIFESQPNSSDDNPFIVGSRERLSLASGWVPERSLDESLGDMIASIR